MDTYIYEYGDKLYINLTNVCSNACVFCLRNTSDGVGGESLWLSREPTAEEVIALLDKKDLDKYREFVFCGFGEPLYAFDRLVEVGAYLKGRGKKVRLNTNGQGEFIVGAGAALRLVGAVDTVSISLNASDAEKYQEVCCCAFGKAGYDAMLRFAKECKDAGLRVILSVVDTIGTDEIERCKAIANGIGVTLRIRNYEK
ncbi:MAG: TatD family nuclease-associated radical SAM protein [Clostridiales bacterium]|jgi:TatD family-associated radical SAM protein|nr:TatD family nuclease-associated radical SAM protein [Clostridiales bacterium]